MAAKKSFMLPTTMIPTLVVGPVFLCFEYAADIPRGRKRQTPVVPFKHKHGARIAYSRSGKPFVHEYPHPESYGWEKAIGQLAKAHMGARRPTVRPVALLVHAFVPIPESWNQKEKEAALCGALLPTSKPDWDNFGKVTDSLNKIVWLDDSQVCDGRVIKAFSARPALRIEVREFIEP